MRAIRTGRRGGDRGAAAVEYLAFFPLFLVVLLVCLEAYVSLVTVERIDGATRTGARVASMSGVASGRAAARGSMPGWLNRYTIRFETTQAGGVRCVVRAKVPLLWPGIPFDVAVIRRVEMPMG
ncbi:TadE/TadG family type IV pilus assembly protein [Actinoallomurus iriomotensis]|uniref:Pilus assembly protein n=1 Tax=Actinoallomurus iriomotensis TaxID=478107 RepID=A0A9W6S4N3_9ACTN|nr:TadE/TadG family type IV pilus assembly protein [Actinoallomurus iriomotensis]GLY85315.1 hypothetical protein Airi02_032440 [Actinoallomurus iriomotensis]